MATTDDRKLISFPKTKAEATAEFNRSTYGEVIRANRIRLGLSQPQLADMIHTSKNYVSNWEVGRTRPDMNIIPALCEALQITISQFFGVPGSIGELSYDEQKHMRSYAELNARDRLTVDNLTDSLLAMEDDELRERCKAEFLTIFHNENMAAAGSLNYLGDEADGEPEFVRRDAISERADEIITVTGNSMEPTFYAGDDLLIEHTDTLEPGEIGIIVINGEGFVKEYRENGVYSHNAKEYPFRRFLPGDNVHIVGRVLGKVSKRHLPTKQEAAILDELRRDGQF
jgi:repressor LexA